MYSLTDFWTYLYKDVFHENEFNFTVFGSFAWNMTIFWVVGIWFIIVDTTGWPKWMLRYKIQPGKNEPVDPKKMKKAVKAVLFNDFCVTLPYMVLLYPLAKYVGCSCKPEDLPGVLRFLFDFFCIVIIEAFMFYYTHRLGHWGPLYRTIHKKHHEWTASVGIVANYAHPIEHFVCNISTLLLPPIIMRSHLFTAMFWYYMNLSTTVVHHSGYHLPVLSSSEFHDYHHLTFNCNYGIPMIDKLHGTEWKDPPAGKEMLRHQTLYSFKSMRELYPDDDKKKSK